MLKYSIKLSEPRGYDEIEVNDLYLSEDMSFISGITRHDYGLVNGQKLMLEFNDNSSFKEVVATIKNVTRQGYVIFNQLFYIEEYNGIKMLKYIDGKWYFSTDEGKTISINTTNYEIEEGNKIHIPTKYWIEDGKLTIGEITYDVDIQLFRTDDGNFEVKNENLPIVTIKGGVQLEIKSCNKNDWEKVTKFILHKNNDTVLSIDSLSCADKFYYFYYGMNIDSDLSDQTKILDKSNSKHYMKFDYKKIEYYADINNKHFVKRNDKAVFGEEEYKLEFEWRNVMSSRYLHLFVDEPFYKIYQSQKIIVESVDKSIINCYVNKDSNDKEYVIYCGNKYYLNEDTIDYMLYDGVKYKLFYTEDNWGLSETVNSNGGKFAYIEVSGETKPILVYADYCKRHLNINETNIFGNGKENKYDLIKYKNVTINNTDYLVYSFNNAQDKINEYVTVIQKEKYILSIDEVVSSNMLRCHVVLNEDGEDNGICNKIVNNKNKYTFSLFNVLFESYNIDKESFLLSGRGDIFDKIKVYNPCTYIKLPMLLGNEYSTNVRQSDILENIFFKNEIEKSINDIVDMEREIYYPCYNSAEEGEKPILNTVNEIQFDLHFRSRNMDDWKINEDVFKDGQETTIKHDWNIFDYYESDDLNKLLNNENGYYQPSDLLYFLNFTDDDIFYQKSKVGKSFLRLLFFNSDDVYNQTLLYSCTVFIDEGKLYKTYIDNMTNKKNNFVDVLSEDKLISTSISVNSEPCDSVGNMNFDKNKRLSASFSIKNRYEASESSEGFYLYVFKDYCEKLHEEPIFMKIEFNHAGEGRTINFTIPYKITENGSYELIDFDDNTKLNEFKKGYPLSELNKHMFIPLESVYDDVNNRYCYYMPQWLCQNSDKENVMKFNLYEIKIKDES